METTVARQTVINHLTTLVSDCKEALAATDTWQDYAPRDRARSLALFREKQEVASRLLQAIENDEPAVRADWRRVMPRDDQWNAVFKAIFVEHYG
jgi:hypothetical protein